MSQSLNQQLTNLLIEKSINGLDDQQQNELIQLQRDCSISDGQMQAESERIELSVAAADLAWFGDSTDEPMPERLAEKVASDAAPFLPDVRSSTDSNKIEPASTDHPASSHSTANRFWMGWALIATAACLLFVLNSGIFSIQSPTPAVAMQAMMNQPPDDMTRWNLVAGTDLNGAGISNSQLIWSDSLQQGYMKFRGLKINDPDTEQYQLWIFESPDQKFPIDGGVFNIESENQTIPIDAKIKVDKTKFFAVTVERPGGVVVSDRGRIASTAVLVGP